MDKFVAGERAGDDEDKLHDHHGRRHHRVGLVKLKAAGGWQYLCMDIFAEITDAADVGLGTFYNHFDSKDELYAAAVNEVLDEHGALLDAGRREGQDPAEALAITVRSTARLVLTNPEMAQILATQGMAILDSGSGLIPRAREVLKEAVSSGRFAHAEVEILLSEPRKAKELLGWEPTVSLEDGLAQVAEWLRPRVDADKAARYHR